ncbi:MucBP domain-containing protein [Listeria innocua]|uniref:MucBP domain-containing protein n=2 Tax=Listeria innocua TaxID=1642 RepID=UPI0039082D5F|nr:MucBP domain-containing protein [Listeria innocua]HBM3740893.1 MucBP domain-containing protein [Listeria innocua]HBM3747784.1 MucBP domain-containing protein [Listeria innocua]HBM3814457.1 MucBP domain-containing protein [Listeria innocua]HBM3941322.1 MucBP domain-containing protein [Listeria innocua]
MRKTFLILICSMLLATLVPFTFPKANTEPTSWIETELDGNEAFISATERNLNKKREDITLADVETITSLDPVGASSIPDNITDYKNLTRLYITQGTLTEVPESIGELKKLTFLSFYNNKLTEFPTVVYDLPALNSLLLQRNNISEIPEEITNMSSHLSSLDVRNNNLISIPDKIFTTKWASRSGQLIIDTEGNQITSDVPVDYLDNYNNGGNMLENYNYRQKQDQLVYKGDPIVVPYKTDFKQLTPDKSKLGLASNNALYPTHEFEYYDDGSSTLENGVATTEGEGFITIKSTLSTTSNPFAKVRVPIVVEAPPEGSDVTVEYKSTTGETIAPSETLKGLLEANYTSEAKTIPGYTLTETPANANGTFFNDPQTVTYVYSKDPVPAKPVTVKYVDDKGKELAPSETFTGFIDDDYTSTEKTIEGYTLVETPANANGKLTADQQTVNYIYTKNIIPAESVTINYVSDTGKELAEQTVLDGNIGDSYSSFAKTIQGYKLTTTPTNANGTFSDTKQTVNYVYTKDKTLLKAKIGKVEVEFVDSTNTPISNPLIVEGEIGKTYKIPHKEITGYTLKKEPSNELGTFDQTPKKVTFVYQKEDSSEKSPSNKTTFNKSITKAESSTVGMPKLPKTGDKSPLIPSLVGILLLSSAIVLWRKNQL